MHNLLKIKNIFKSFNINEIATISINELIIQKPHLLNREDYLSCIFFIVPYNTAENQPHLISKYAVPQDYHLFFNELYKKLIPILENEFPNDRFIGFSDASPFNEKDAISKTGIGFYGDNGLIINDTYGSYIFIGEVVSTINFINNKLNPIENHAKNECLHCDICKNLCPTNVIETKDFTKCLSYISQKKSKSDEEMELLLSNNILWGCDICQSCCPHNINAELSNIPFFKMNIINNLTCEIINEMTDEEFNKRAFSWRGKKTILDNLKYFQENNKLNC